MRHWAFTVVVFAALLIDFQSLTTCPASAAASWYTLTHKAKPYAECVNLAQDLVTDDPEPKVIVLSPGSQIQAFELAWTQEDYQGTRYLYTRDIQDIRIRTRSGLNGCMSFQETLNDDCSDRDAGLSKYLGYFMDHAGNSNIYVVGGAPDHERSDHLDASPHYRSLKELNAAEGTNF